MANRYVKGAMKRCRNIAAWMKLMVIGLPTSYILLPVSCCISNPLAAGETEMGMERVGENAAVLMTASIAVATGGCCCFGCFGSAAPDEMF